MGTSVKREVSLTNPMTLKDMQEFIDAAREMGVPTNKRLDLAITRGYSDMRESWPDGVTITARP